MYISQGFESAHGTGQRLLLLIVIAPGNTPTRGYEDRACTPLPQFGLAIWPTPPQKERQDIRLAKHFPVVALNRLACSLPLTKTL
ncbi:MAG: hypothetical protein JWQ87_4798 [Candidatus Sulfotelmatobacter sp.]|nr:hypothetical protein [Candidatus Sulfotelmatobacter sp.]